MAAIKQLSNFGLEEVEYTPPPEPAVGPVAVLSLIVQFAKVGLAELTQ